MNIPTTTKGYETEFYQVTSSSPAQTETGSGRAVQADELNVRFKHKLHFVPTGTMNIDTTLVIFSSAQEGKIVRLQDRPADELSDNSLIKVSVPSGVQLADFSDIREYRRRLICRQ